MPPDVLVVDCPWQFRDRLPGPARGASKHYACMPVEELKKFPLPDLGPNVAMFFWRVASMQQEALDVVSAWGFTVKSELVWLKETATGKPAFGMGHYTRAAHEVCLICTRGKARPAIHTQRSVFSAPVGAHSQKPDRFYSIVREMYPNSRKFELFARTVRQDFIQFGNELGKLGEAS